MSGFARHGDDENEIEGIGNLEPWEALVVDAVGNVIDFWKFKRNQGKVWALLFLRGRPLAAAEIQESLGLSKGAVSMLVRELEQWGVITRVRAPRDASWHFAAEADLMKMVRTVIEEREAALVRRVRADLEEAERLAKKNGRVSAEVLERLARMRMLATMVDKALASFLASARLDAAGVFTALLDKRARLRR